ncbi:hypothetical protein BKA93DRAFT_813977 [Sparassis latifolia]
MRPQCSHLDQLCATFASFMSPVFLLHAARLSASPVSSYDQLGLPPHVISTVLPGGKKRSHNVFRLYSLSLKMYGRVPLHFGHFNPVQPRRRRGSHGVSLRSREHSYPMRPQCPRLDQLCATFMSFIMNFISQAFLLRAARLLLPLTCVFL